MTLGKHIAPIGGKKNPQMGLKEELENRTINSHAMLEFFFGVGIPSLKSPSW